MLKWKSFKTTAAAIATTVIPGNWKTLPCLKDIYHGIKIYLFFYNNRISSFFLLKTKVFYFIYTHIHFEMCIFIGVCNSIFIQEHFVELLNIQTTNSVYNFNNGPKDSSV